MINNSKKYILIYYVVMIVFIGIPIWYKTTTPVRYKLPDIKSLMVHSQRLVSRVQVNVIDVVDLKNDSKNDLNNNSMNDDDYDQLKIEFENNWSRFDSQSKGIIYEFQWVIRKLKDDVEDKLFAQDDLLAIDELTKQLKVRFKQGNLSIYLLSDQKWQQLVVNKFGDKFRNVVYGSYRSFYVRKSYAKSTELARLVHSVLDNDDQLDDNNNNNNINELDVKIPKNVQSSLMNLKLTIYLNLMTEELNDSITFQQSDAFKSIDKIKTKFLDELTGTSFNIKVISQMINNALPDDLIENRLIIVDSKDSKRYFDLASAPELLNRIEARISPPSDKHTLEFNIIIPSSKKSELHFYDKQTKQQSNAIVTSYQPSTLIWNRPNDFNIGFKSFIRKQLGLPFKQPKYALRRDRFFAKWEFDNLIRQITVKQLTKTLESLESLEKLLNKISNIVIEEKISKRMFDAVDYAHQSIDELENYGLGKAFEYSSKAFINAEHAYYDPSLLSLLYFPEDQKYAIYFPLFFPIAIQLASYFIGKFKHHFFNKEKDNKEK